jgi:sortase A
MLRTGAAILLATASVLFGQAAWMRTKAAVASVLIERSLEATLRDGRTRRPWSWADFHPVARLSVPRLDVVEPVLSGATGATLAFGLGQVPGTGTDTVIAGHRDRWAGFLRDVRVGDALVLEAAGARRRYRADAIRIVSSDDVEVLSPSGDDRLALVTCWPFGGVVRSSQRLVVECSRTP